YGEMTGIDRPERRLAATFAWRTEPHVKRTEREGLWVKPVGTHACPENIVGSGQDGNQDRARHGACLWRRPFHGLGKCLLGRFCRGVLYPVDCRGIVEQGPAAVIRDPLGKSGGPHSHCHVRTGSLAVPDRHEHFCRLLHLHDAWYFPMVFLVRRRVLGTAPCTCRRLRPAERFSDSYNSFRGNSAGYRVLQPCLSLDLADQ